MKEKGIMDTREEQVFSLVVDYLDCFGKLHPVNIHPDNPLRGKWEEFSERAHEVDPAVSEKELFSAEWWKNILPKGSVFFEGGQGKKAEINRREGGEGVRPYSNIRLVLIRILNGYIEGSYHLPAYILNDVGSCPQTSSEDLLATLNNLYKVGDNATIRATLRCIIEILFKKRLISQEECAGLEEEIQAEDRLLKKMEEQMV